MKTVSIRAFAPSIARTHIVLHGTTSPSDTFPFRSSVTAGPEARSRSAEGPEGSVRGLRVAGIWEWAFGPRGQTMPPDPPNDTGGSACSSMVARAFDALTAILDAGQASSRRHAIQAGGGCAGAARC